MANESEPRGGGGVDDAVADRVLDKLKVFVEGLEPDERAVLAALLAPGVSGALATEAEVSGFAATGWSPDRLPDALAARVRDGRLRIEMD